MNSVVCVFFYFQASRPLRLNESNDVIWYEILFTFAKISNTSTVEVVFFLKKKKGFLFVMWDFPLENLYKYKLFHDGSVIWHLTQIISFSFLLWKKKKNNGIKFYFKQNYINSLNMLIESVIP